MNAKGLPKLMHRHELAVKIMMKNANDYIYLVAIVPILVNTELKVLFIKTIILSYYTTNSSDKQGF